MTALALRVFWVSLSTAPVLLPLLLCAERLLRRYRAKSCYLLWLLLAVRLLLPVQLPLPHPPVTVTAPAAALPAAREPLSGLALSPSAAPVSAPALTAADLAAGVWLLGAVLVLSSQLGGYLLARRRLLRGAQPLSAPPELPDGCGVPVLLADVAAPMTLGLLRPVVLLPCRTAREDLPLILRHELCHVRRKDLWYKALFLLCAALHWFNPLVWRLARAAGETVELCCDEAVVSGQSADVRRAYGQLLLRSAAARPAGILSAPFGSGDLKGRLMNLFIQKKNGAALVCTAVCAAALLGSLVGCEVSAAELPAPAQSAESTAAASGTAELTWVWPVDGSCTLSNDYGERVHPVTGETSVHSGIDLAAEPGTAVVSAADGVVRTAQYSPTYGNYVVVEHSGGLTTLYAHMVKLLVEEGAAVQAGTHLGAVGSTGLSTGAHLHFEVRQDGIAADPLPFFPELELG